jgi:hypothetical protein
MNSTVTAVDPSGTTGRAAPFAVGTGTHRFDGDVAIAYPCTDPLHEAQLVLTCVGVRDNQASRSKFAGQHREAAAGPV